MLRSVTIYGGVDVQVQKKALSQGVHWCVATPGRLLDFLERKWLSLEKLAVLVLDEADRMLNQGFELDLRKIMSYRPVKLQTLLFTATWEPSTKVQLLASDFLVDPEIIEISNASRAANPNITHQFHVCRSEREKLTRLIEQIGQLTDQQKLIVFVNTKAGCLEVQSTLARFRIPSFILQGDMDQASREASLTEFRNKPGVLVATDVAARGLDVDNVKVVFNFDLPTTSDTFVHRVGRTGRAEQHGMAVTLLNPFDRREQQVAQEVANYLVAAGVYNMELHVFLQEGLETGSTFSGVTGGYTHNTGLTQPDIELEGHQLARVLASDEDIVKETLRRGLRFLNIERSKALDDRFRRPKWRFRRLVSFKELREAAKRHEKGEEALGSLARESNEAGESMLGIVHVMITDLYDPTTYVATEMFEVPHERDHKWQVFCQVTEMLMESDDVEFAEQVTGNAAFQEALHATWLEGDTEDEFYFQTFSKQPFPQFKYKPLLHHLCEEGTFVETLRFLLSRFSHQTAEKPWLRLVDVEQREKQYGNTAFHICAYAGHVELLDELVKHAQKHEVPVELLKTTKGETALDVALARNNYACFNLLVPFFAGAQPYDESNNSSKSQSVLVVDGPEETGQPAERVSCDLPSSLSLRDLTTHLQVLLKQLPGKPHLILLKKVHLHLGGSLRS
ncbi:unnamed protein product [Durusdinium trenchii]|uniref:ATP-dependent RNA helicase n=2 Tax=Durusdinium trenchii TaxID=1381693 RepID=A0ABP0SW39_9DINO